MVDITHDFVSAIAVDPVEEAAGKVTPDDWNESHVFELAATSKVVGRKTAGAGAAEECSLSEVLDFIGSAAEGDLLLRGAATWARLAIGTSGKLLTSTGTSAAWTAKPAPRVKVGSTTHNVATTGAQAITGVGFTPVLVLIIAGVSVTKAMSLGFTDGTTDCYLNSLDNFSADTWQIGSTYCLVLTTGAADQATAAFSAFGADGFTLNWAKTGSPTGTATINYICVG